MVMKILIKSYRVGEVRECELMAGQMKRRGRFLRNFYHRLHVSVHTVRSTLPLIKLYNCFYPSVRLSTHDPATYDFLRARLITIFLFPFQKKKKN